MAVTRFLLPSLFLIASTACDSPTKRSDFPCKWEYMNSKSREVIKGLRETKVNCSLPIRLHNTTIQKATLKIQFQDRMAKILQSLSDLVQDVEAAKGLMQCGSSQLEKLERNAKNYKVILTHPSFTVMVEQLRPREATSPPIIQKYPSKETKHLNKVLEYFDDLLLTLGWLIKELNVSCP